MQTSQGLPVSFYTIGVYMKAETHIRKWEADENNLVE
jgi:hypothetical protein